MIIRHPWRSFTSIEASSADAAETGTITKGDEINMIFERKSLEDGTWRKRYNRELYDILGN